jgi:flagellar FliJ protein
MNAALRTIDKVVAIAERQCDQARMRLAQVQQQWQRAQWQLEQLDGYAQEAARRWHARSLQGVDAGLLHHHRQFMDKLGHAIALQRSVIAGHETQVRQARERLQQAERHLASLRKYQQRQLHELARAMQRREQKTMDEMALNVHLHRRHGEANVRGTPT